MGLAVLRKLATMGGAASITALAAQLQENPAKVHRYLASLVETGFVYQDADSSRYVLGPESIFIGLVAQRQAEPVRAAAAELPALLEALNVTCFVALLGENGPLIVRWDDPGQPVTVNVRVGSVLPVLWSATGRIFAAFAPSKRLDALIEEELRSPSPEQRKQVRSAAAARKLIEDVRDRGIAAVDGTLLAGISGFAVPVLDVAGRAVAVIGALGVSGSFDVSVDGPNARALKAAGARASQRLGYGAGAS
ncbi:IclR family transcriptional regulator [Ramlibacter sp. 2FC]|uniref:IclR family transcriptional regulator n=1 Tax=Ramlibacter sp. 2FC TaxID=2502188 RepID=UPI0010F632CC|nr:IclR family transcriptional regulator [Ramlibacter sp. 2FC]